MSYTRCAVLAGDKLNDYDALINAGVGMKIEMLKVSDSSASFVTLI